MSSYGQTPSTEPTGIGVSAGGSIDGTPTRVATLIIVTLVGIAAFKWGNIKFNIAAGGQVMNKGTKGFILGAIVGLVAYHVATGGMKMPAKQG